jgi:hypothetical protein
MSSAKEPSKDKDKSKVHKLSLKGSSRLVAEFVCSSDICPMTCRHANPFNCLVPILHSHHFVRYPMPQYPSEKENNEWHSPRKDRGCSATKHHETNKPVIARLIRVISNNQVPAWRLPSRGLHSVRQTATIALTHVPKSDPANSVKKYGLNMLGMRSNARLNGRTKPADPLLRMAM